MQNTTNRRQDGGFRDVLRVQWRWFAAFALAGIGLRCFFVAKFLMITPDSLVYGDFAKNWLASHVYGISGPDGPAAADFRLPGYPAYLVLSFLIGGINHYGPACIGQIFVDLGTCFVVAALAWRIAGARAARWAFALAALCPFMANYASTALTETWAIFFAALALLWAVDGVERMANPPKQNRLGWATPWMWCGLAIGAGTLLRPDGGMILIAIWLWMGWKLLLAHPSKNSQGGAPTRLQLIRAAVVVGVFTFLPLVPWTLRNAITMRAFHPLPSTTAVSAGEFYPAGFNAWLRTWLVDYSSLEDIGFNVSGEEIPFDRLPDRAFDSEEQRQRTQRLFDAYNETKWMSPELDAQFGELARERARHAPFRQYVEIPVLRGLDLWLRPRVEMLPVDVHWWIFEDDPHDSGIGIALGVLNLALLGLAAWGYWKVRKSPYVGLLVTFVVVRTVLLIVMATPEPRYVLECYPVVLALAGAAWGRRS